MPIDDFEENLDFIRPERAESLDEDAFKKYIEKQGPDFAKGFFAAMRYVEPKVRSIYRTLETSNGYNENTRAGMRNKAMALENHIEQVLAFASKDITKVQPPKPD